MNFQDYYIDIGGIESGKSIAAVIASASHDIRKSGERRDREIVRKALRYAKRKSYVSLKIIRAADDAIDDYKFIMPVFDNLSSLDLQVFYMLKEQEIPRIVVVADKDAFPKLEVIRDFTNAGKERLRIIEEPKPTGIFETHKKALEELVDLPDSSRIGFIALDLPLAFDYKSILYREEPFDGIYMDCNAREKVFSRNEKLFDRNWYFVIKDREGEVVHVKEGNKWEYNLGRLRSALKKVKANNSGHRIIYRDREAGNVFSHRFLWTMLKLLPSRILTNPDLAAKFVYRGLPAFLEHFMLEIDGETHADIVGAEAIAGFLAGMPVRLEFKNTNPGWVRDIDDRYDRDYYHLIFDAAVSKYGGIKEAFTHLTPYGNELFELDNIMGDVNKKILMLNDFPGFENSRRTQLRKMLDLYRRINRETYGLEIKDAFDSSGKFIGVPSKGDDIEGSLNYFVEKSGEFAIAARRIKRVT